MIFEYGSAASWRHRKDNREPLHPGELCCSEKGVIEYQR